MLKKPQSLYITASLMVSSIMLSSTPTLAGATATEKQLPTAAKSWWQQGQAAVTERLKKQFSQQPGAARNIILFVGDGMSITTVTAARILAGQQQGKSGEENLLSFEHFPATALSKTYNTNQQTPDSAGTMTAIVTGVKTKAGMLSISDAVQRGHCHNIQDNTLTTLLELAERQQKATGIVTTSRLTHATPAATYAKAPERNWEDDSELSSEAQQQGCTDIASQFINFSMGDGIEVAMGGGRRHFLPQPAGKRNDNKNLVELWQQQHPDGQYIANRQQLLSLKPDSINKLLGLFNDSHMQFDDERKQSGFDEPSLAEMTSAAIQRLKTNQQGFFLMVEAGRIDHAHHAGNAYHALHDTIALSEAVSAALQQVNLQETLIVVTADHSHVFTMAGYPTRGNPILGYAVGNDEHGLPQSQPLMADDGRAFTTLGYHNGPGASEDLQQHQLAQKLVPESPSYHQRAVVPLRSETHGGDDVAIYATGPGSHLFRGVMEQNVIFHLIDHAAGLSK